MEGVQGELCTAPGLTGPPARGRRQRHGSPAADPQAAQKRKPTLVNQCVCKAAVLLGHIKPPVAAPVHCGGGGEGGACCACCAAAEQCDLERSKVPVQLLGGTAGLTCSHLHMHTNMLHMVGESAACPNWPASQPAAHPTPAQCRPAACAAPPGLQRAPRQLATGQQVPHPAAAAPPPRSRIRRLSRARWPTPAACLAALLLQSIRRPNQQRRQRYWVAGVSQRVPPPLRGPALLPPFAGLQQVSGWEKRPASLQPLRGHRRKQQCIKVSKAQCMGAAAEALVSTGPEAGTPMACAAALWHMRHQQSAPALCSVSSVSSRPSSCQSSTAAGRQAATAQMRQLKSGRGRSKQANRPRQLCKQLVCTWNISPPWLLASTHTSMPAAVMVAALPAAEGGSIHGCCRACRVFGLLSPLSCNLPCEGGHAHSGPLCAG